MFSLAAAVPGFGSLIGGRRLLKAADEVFAARKMVTREANGVADVAIGMKVAQREMDVPFGRVREVFGTLGARTRAHLDEAFSEMRANPERGSISLPGRGGASHVDNGALDDLGRPTWGWARLRKGGMGGGSAPSRRIHPPGWQGEAAGHSRGHLIAGSMGGSGRDARNLVTQGRHANNAVMRQFEKDITDVVNAGQTVDYVVRPAYVGSELIPRGVTLHASGDQGFSLYVTILNLR